MLREIHIDSFSKIINNYKPELFATLTVLQSRPYNPTVQSYHVVDLNQNRYQLYLTQKELEPILKDIEFIQRSPKILLIKTDRDHIIIEEQIDQNLYEMLLTLENKNTPMPFLDQPLARAILRGLKEGLDNYAAHGIDYNAVNPKNIVRRGSEWEFSLTGLLVRNEKESADYYKSDIRKDGRVAYALGTLLFKLLFGFVPFEKRKERLPFSFKDYLKYLDREQSTKKALKIYYFADRLVEVSEQAKQLIQLALTGDLIASQFFNHEYFDKFSLPGRREVSGGNRQIKMLSLFPSGQQSAVMAAIEHKRKYPQQRINAKLIFAHQFSRAQVVEHLKNHPVLSQVGFEQDFKEERVKESLRTPVKQNFRLQLEYFYREEAFDPQTDFPCRDLINVIKFASKQWEGDETVSALKEAAIKLYAFPYAIAFQLLKTSDGQGQEVVDRMQKVTQDLLQISQLHFSNLIEPLHKTQLVVGSFEEIKLRFREGVNWLYRHFLTQAIRKYNVKKDSATTVRSRSKTQGLQYYRLCLKLIECSLLVRKQGKDLDLTRIETSGRKEIQSDLDQLLRQYFPNKIELG